MYLAIAELLATKALPAGVRASVKYRRIAASVAEVGLIEALSIARQKGSSYLLLDGHMRFDALRFLGATEAPCVVADDDESFTYNTRVNRLATIQGHYMIVRALDRGVSEEKLARAQCRGDGDPPAPPSAGRDPRGCRRAAEGQAGRAPRLPEAAQEEADPPA